MPALRNLRFSYTLLLFLLFSPFFCRAQADSCYIRPVEHKIGTRAYIGQNFMLLNYEQGGNEREFLPNSPVQLGLGFSIYNTIIGLDFGYGFHFQDKETYGETKAFDFQVHHYGRKFVVDLYVQQYKGFYEESGKDILLYPDMRINRYSAHGYYVFNHRQFSYKALFAQTERQVRSAGSWLLGTDICRIKIRAEELQTSRGGPHSYNYQIGLNGGYAYIWALGRYWNLGISSTAGLSLGRKAFKSSGSGVSVYPTISPRFSCVYDRGEWALTTSFAGNALFMPIRKDESFNMLSGTFQFAFVKRWGK